MLQEEHSAILSTFIKLPFVIKIFILSIFEWPFFTGFTVCAMDKEIDSDISQTYVRQTPKPKGCTLVVCSGWCLHQNLEKVLLLGAKYFL